MNYYEIAEYNPVRSDFLLPADFLPLRRYNPIDVLSADALKRFSDLGFSLREVQLFMTLPNTVAGIHVDGTSLKESKSAINYVVNGVGLMKWYNPKFVKSKVRETPAGTDYILYNPDECVETDSINLSKLTLVEVCTPHNVINDSPNAFRYCFSIRYADNNFEKTLERLKPWINL